MTTPPVSCLKGNFDRSFEGGSTNSSCANNILLRKRVKKRKKWDKYFFMEKYGGLQIVLQKTWIAWKMLQ
jgi:hypothetical protein